MSNTHRRPSQGQRDLCRRNQATAVRAPVIYCGPIGDRLRGSPHLQRIIERVVGCGPRPVAELLIEMLEDVGASPEALDRLERWAKIDPKTVRQVGGRDFPRPPLRVVPRQERGR